ncbi:MAG: cytochrome b/b6 domain-containing protein, partial [Pseudomonadota bacterium]
MTPKRYNGVAMALHWAIAAAILFTLLLGWRMVDLPFGEEKFAEYQLHKSLGFTILA